MHLHPSFWLSFLVATACHCTWQMMQLQLLFFVDQVLLYFEAHGLTLQVHLRTSWHCWQRLLVFPSNSSYLWSSRSRNGHARWNMWRPRWAKQMVLGSSRTAMTTSIASTSTGWSSPQRLMGAAWALCVSPAKFRRVFRRKKAIGELLLTSDGRDVPCFNGLNMVNMVQQF